MSRGSEELVVLLDDAGRPIGTAPKREVHHRETPLHLAFSCYVFDPDGRFLLTQRALSKRTWPGAWTNSCCGHPAPGERVDEAVGRRVGQELGLDLIDVRLALADFRYRAVMDDGIVENELCPVYTAVCPSPSSLSPDVTEVASAAWVDWFEFRRDVLESRLEITPWCASQLLVLSPDPR